MGFKGSCLRFGGKPRTNQRAACFQLRCPQRCSRFCSTSHFEFVSTCKNVEKASIMLKATAKMEKSSTASASSSSSAHGSASWAQASAEAGLGGLTVTEVALAAMFDQLKEVPDPIFAVSMHTLTASSICQEFVENVETVEKLSRKCREC